MNKAALSVSALVKSLWANRLSDAELEKLSSAPSAYAAISLLSGTRAYKNHVSRTENPRAVKESLQSALYADIKKIRRFERAAGNAFTDYFIYRTDVEGLGNAIAALSAGTYDNAMAFRAAFSDLSGLELLKTAGARDLKELENSAAGTPYGALLKNVLTDYMRSGDIISAEAALTRAADVRFLEVSGGRRGKTDVPSASFRKTGLFRLRAAESDLSLIRDFARVSRFSVPEQAKSALLSPVMTALPAAKITALANLSDPGEIADVLKGTDYSALDPADLETSADEYITKLLNKTLVYSFDPQELVFAYVLSKSAEIKKAVGIIRRKEWQGGRQQANEQSVIAK